jgi:hypothetical protein
MMLHCNLYNIPQLLEPILSLSSAITRVSCCISSILTSSAINVNTSPGGPSLLWLWVRIPLSTWMSLNNVHNDP